MRERSPKYVNLYVDRTGKERIYLRRPGRPRLALPAPYKSEAFWIAYHRAMAEPDLPIGSSKTKAGTISEAIVGYYGSSKYTTLGDSTRTNYRQVLEAFRRVHGDGPLAKLQPKHLNGIMDKKAATPEAANTLRKRLRGVFAWAIGAGLMATNPAADASPIKVKTKGFRTWSELDIDRYRERWPEASPQRLAMEILLHTGLRRSDAVRLGWKHVLGDAFRIETAKTGAELLLPIHSDLAALIAACPKDDPTFIITKFGKPRSAKSFTNWLREAAHSAGLPSDSSPHGLRKAACRRLAQAGCSAHEIMSITGHTDIRQVETYCRDAEQGRLARGAMHKSASMFDRQLTNGSPVSQTTPDNQLNNNGEF